MAGTAERTEKIGVPGSITALLTENFNDLVDDVETLRGATRIHFTYLVEDLAAGADIAARAIWIAPAALTIESVKAVYEAASVGVDGTNTTVLTLRNITEGVDVATVTKTAVTSANAAETLAITAANADIAANDILGVVVTNGATADTPKITLVVVGHYQTIDAASDMTASKIANSGGTAF